MGWAVSFGVVAAIGVLAVLLFDQKRRWDYSADRAPCLFSSETPRRPRKAPGRTEQVLDSR